MKPRSAVVSLVLGSLGLVGFITLWWWVFTDTGTNCDISVWLSTSRGWAWLLLVAGTIGALAAIAAGIVELGRVGIWLSLLAMIALVMVFIAITSAPCMGGGNGT